MLVGLVAALGAALLFGVAAAVQAVVVRHERMVCPRMGLVGLCYLLGWGLHLVAISRLPLYVAQVGVAGSLVVTSLIAAKVVHEPLETRHWAAIAAMFSGLVLLVAGAGRVGNHEFHHRFTLALYVAFAAVLVLGIAASRAGGPRSGLVLGVLAGISYAGSPVATRSLVDPSWDVRSIAPALTIAMFGLCGFWLYSLALQRTSVTAATAPLVLCETLVPAVLGILVFGDGVQPGWGPVALLGFVVSTAGALVLSGAEGRLEHLDEHRAQAQHPSPAATV
jgi:drug/metabolite transporter (DMT)-like permease